MAIYANLVVDQGTDFYSEVTVEGGNGLPYDLTGYTVQGQVRRTYTSSTAYPFTALVTDAPGGQISIELSNTATSQMKAGRYVYDLEIVETSTGDITRVVEGQLEVTPGVTR